MLNFWRSERGIGLGAVVIVGTLSWGLADFIPRLGAVTIALLLGIVVGNVLLTGGAALSGGLLAEKHLLPIAIVLLGVELQLAALIALGPTAVLIIGVSISTAVLTSTLLGQRLGYSRPFTLLMGAGNGICGSSAVAATSLVLRAQQADTGLTIGIVNLLGTIGIFVLPPLAHALGLTEIQSGLLIGGTLQAVGQVAAAGFSISPEVGNLATVVKMGRVLMLGPVIILIGYWCLARTPAAGGHAGGHSGGRMRVPVPRFILAFFALSVIASSGVLPPPVVSAIATAGKYLLVLAMVGIGLRIQLRALLHSGLSALLFGGLVAIIQIAVTLAVILWVV